jgi:hypothetical protein
VRQRVLARVEALAGQQRLGKGARAVQRVELGLHGGGRIARGVARTSTAGHDAGELDDRCRLARGVGRRQRRERSSWQAHGDWRNSRTRATCSACTSVGAWPTPGSSTSRARGTALRHRLGRLMRQQVAVGAADQQGRAAQRVVALPQHGLAGGRQLGRHRLEGQSDARVVVRHEAGALSVVDRP